MKSTSQCGPNLLIIAIFILIHTLALYGQLDPNSIAVEGSIQIDKTSTALTRLILNTSSFNDPGRCGILFTNNDLAPFLGDDQQDLNFGFYSTWSNNRSYDTKLHIHGKATNSWGNRLTLTHDGEDGYLLTDKGNMILQPDEGAGRIGINTDSPGSTLTVDGSVELESGQLIFPDGSTQSSAGQVTLYYSTVSALVANGGGILTQTATCPSGYRVLGGGWDQITTSQRPFSKLVVAARNGPNGNASWRVTAVNNATYIVAIKVTAICAPYQ